ncbi:hypothetical protein K439DRAFT_1372836 [Ramaria rubella]|nr:hypothetical protein K439DRAFT_1372836 [Ramaria rubella]
MHNTRIEQLWVQFVHCWQAFCMRLERMHQLDCDNPSHLWLHHHIFLSLINANCRAFQTKWNLHLLSGHKNKSPLDLHFISQTEHGFAVDDFQDVHPEILEQYHNVDMGPAHRDSHQTGAGYPSDESDDDLDNEEGEDFETNEIQCQIAADIHANVHYKPVKTPQSASPFGHPAQEVIFFAALNNIQTAHLIPLGFGLKASEWENGEYPSYELMMFGRRKKEISVELLASRLPCAIAWGQALHCMQSFIFQIGDE